jgi:hypothetical protein
VAGPADAASLWLAPPRELSGSNGRCEPGKQRIPVTQGKRKRCLGRLGAAGCSAARRPRRGAATPRRLTASRPSALLRSAVARSLAGSDRPPQDPSDQARTGRSSIEVGSRSTDRVHTGFDPGSGSYRGPLRGSSARCTAEASSTRPLQVQAQGSIGASALATAACSWTSAAEQGLEAGRRQRS